MKPWLLTKLKLKSEELKPYSTWQLKSNEQKNVPKPYITIRLIERAPSCQVTIVHAMCRSREFMPPTHHAVFDVSLEARNDNTFREGIQLPPCLFLLTIGMDSDELSSNGGVKTISM